MRIEDIRNTLNEVYGIKASIEDITILVWAEELSRDELNDKDYMDNKISIWSEMLS